jgi:hypothetical protein
VSVGDDSFSFAFSGSFTTSAHSAGIIACSTSSPAAKKNQPMLPPLHFMTERQ